MQRKMTWRKNAHLATDFLKKLLLCFDGNEPVTQGRILQTLRYGRFQPLKNHTTQFFKNASKLWIVAFGA